MKYQTPHGTFKDFFMNETEDNDVGKICTENDEHTQLLSLIKRRSTIYMNNRDGEQLHRLFNSVIECVRQFEVKSIHSGIREYFDRERQINLVDNVFREVLERLDRPVHEFDEAKKEEELLEDIKELEQDGKIDPKC